MVDLKLLEIEALVKINLRDIKHLKKSASYIDEQTKDLFKGMINNNKYMLKVITKMKGE